LIPAASAPSTAVFPPVLRDDGSLVGSSGAASTARGGRPATHASARSATAQFTSTCAVPRGNVNLQVMQPSPQDVDWAANLAGRGLLTGSSARPQGYANLGLPAYSPSVDFPLPAPLALWDYNSGLHPNSGSGPWGLGPGLVKQPCQP
jgi:hypothetical protein